MGNRWYAKLGLVLAAPLLGCLFLIWDTSNREDPLWHGKRLSYWLRADGPDTERTRDALTALGTNCIPLLLHWIRNHEQDHVAPPFTHTLNEWLGKQPIIKYRFPMDGRRSRTRIAVETLPLLGPDEKAAIPGLMALLGDDPDPLVPVLVQLIREGDAEMRGYAYGRLASLGDHARPAIPDLQAILASTSLDDVRFDIRWTLKMIDILSAPTNAPSKVVLESATEPK